MKAIKTFNLTKKFPRTTGYLDLLPFREKRWVIAAENINLDIEEGEFFGLLGTNGAGKTTLIKMLCGLVLPSSGTAQVFGQDIVRDESEVKKLVGLVSAEERSFYWRLTGRENLQFNAALYHLVPQQAGKRIDELLNLVGLADKADVRFQNYSTGMRQKLAIARGLLSKPRILFVDEPTRSLDPVSAQAIRCFFKEKVVSQETAVVLATHNLNEAEQLCSRLAIMDHGQVKALGSVSELRSLFQSKERCELQVGNFPETLLNQLGCIEGVTDCRPAGRQNGFLNLELMISDRIVLPRILEAMVNSGVEVYNCQVKELPLDEIFVHALRSDHTKEMN
jgi:ABC-2 type transport system ATP-binding protein